MGLALALRSRRSAPALWLLVLAAQGPDWVDGVLDLAGYRWHNPAWSPHGLVPVIACTLVATASAATLAPRMQVARGRAAALVATAYLSHWPADFVTGWKPTWPGGPMVGLRLYGHPAADLAVETVTIVAGWWLWRRSLPADVRRARWALIPLLLGLLLALQVAADVVMARPTSEVWDALRRAIEAVSRLC